MSTEFTIINDIFRCRAHSGANVLLGIGDDAAITRLSAESDLVTATDAVVAGTHFLDYEPPRSVGHRCLAVNLSDLAAMGAEPLWASLALGLPRFDRSWLEEFADGFFALADRYAVNLIGGDTVHSETLFAAVTVQGRLPKGAGLTRSGARPGDLIYVTGHPGDAAAGRKLTTGPARAPIDLAQALHRQFYFPEPRIKAGIALRSVASAMLDLSDGLHTDLGRLLDASGAGAILDVASLPLSAALRAAFEPAVALELALCGGDDYELCFTVPPARLVALERVAQEIGCELTALGEVGSAPGLRWQQQGVPYNIPATSFEHFA